MEASIKFMKVFIGKLALVACVAALAGCGGGGDKESDEDREIRSLVSNFFIDFADRNSVGGCEVMAKGTWEPSFANIREGDDTWQYYTNSKPSSPTAVCEFQLDATSAALRADGPPATTDDLRESYRSAKVGVPEINGDKISGSVEITRNHEQFVGTFIVQLAKQERSWMVERVVSRDGKDFLPWELPVD